MALSTGPAVNARRRARNFSAAFLTASQQRILKTFFEIHGQLNKNVDLQVVELDNTGGTDQIVANAPCKLYAVFLKGGSAGGTFNVADHASSANTPTTTIPIAALEAVSEIYGEGHAMAVGMTVDFSQANAGKGVVIIGEA